MEELLGKEHVFGSEFTAFDVSGDLVGISF